MWFVAWAVGCARGKRTAHGWSVLGATVLGAGWRAVVLLGLSLGLSLGLVTECGAKAAGLTGWQASSGNMGNTPSNDKEAGAGEAGAGEAGAGEAGAGQAGSGRRREAEPARVRAARRFRARRGLRPGMAGHGFGGNARAGSGNGQPSAAGLAGGIPVWTAAGPVGVNSASFGLVTGRISALALDPSDGTGNRLYVGTTGGGVWKSQNAAVGTAGGVRFLPVTDGTNALTGAADAGVSVGALTVQPGGTGVVLAGLGDPNDALDSYYGAGLLRSTDGGQTWSLVQRTVDLESGLDIRDYSFVGEGFAGFAWSTANVQLVVAAVSQAFEGTLVDAGTSPLRASGLFYSQDGGASWHLARMTDLNGQDVQGPGDQFATPEGNAATAVVWNPVRQEFVAEVRYHGYYQSRDGVTWTRLPDFPNGQPGAGLTAGNCPTQPGNTGVAGCPIFRGALAVNPQTGDTFAWSVDANNQDQGIWQDQCGLSAGSCTTAGITFGVRLNTAALEVTGLGGDARIANGDYNLTLAALPGGLGAGQDTLLLAGANDLWKCSLANSCVWRNTTNATTCMSAKVGEYQHALAWDGGNPALVFVGNDSGLWRSTDSVGETGSACSTADASHFQNLNGGLGASGSLAEVDALAQSGATAWTMLAGLGVTGFAGVVNGNGTGTAGPWNEVLGGEGGPVAIDQASHLNSWYANSGAGVEIFHCSSATVCTPAGFGAGAGGAGPVVGEAQVANDGLAMPYAAEFRVDAADASQLLIGTCRVWRGPANGAGWSGSNAISPILDGTGGASCNGNSLIRSMTALPTTGGGEAIYVGMAGAVDGGGVAAGHVFAGSVTAGGGAGSWTDVTFSPVTNLGLNMNPFQLDVSSLYADPHDATGGTVYATIAGFGTPTQSMAQVFRTTDGGKHWVSLQSNLPNAPANAVVVDPQDANTVYVATDFGVYSTRAVASCVTTSGCWGVYGTGLPLSPVTQLLATPTGSTSQVLTAGTYGRGVWQAPLATSGAAATTGTVTPAALTFASQILGTTSGAQTITLKATGTVPLVVTGVSTTGAGGGDFVETDTCVGASLARNATCAVRVSFVPTAAGSRSGVLTISANVAGGQLLVPLSGTGQAAGSLTLLPTSLSFGTVQVGQTSASQSIGVQNAGGSPVTISSQVVSAPFAKAATSCGSTLAAGAACAVTMNFAPKQAGGAAGSLTIASSVGPLTAVLSGTGITGPMDTLSTTALTFPATVVGQTSAALVVGLTNGGGLPLTNIGTAVVSGFPGDFTAVSDCGSTLAANTSCGVSVFFTPSVAKTETGTLQISDALHSQNVSLSGAGVKPPVIALSPAVLAFGNQQINLASGAKTLTVQNTGGSAMGAPSFSLSGAGGGNFVLGASTCGVSLSAGASCTVQVSFLPLTAGGTVGTITVSTSTVGVAASAASLTGTGLSPPLLGVNPANLNLGAVALGRTSLAFTVQITNSGQEPLVGLGFSIGGLGGGALPGDFALSEPTDVPACALTGAGSGLNPGVSCSVDVVFSPSLLGVETATLTVTAANAQPATAGLMGTGTPVILLQANPVQLSFPALVVGQVSATQKVTISNLGRQTANGLAVSVTGPYSVVPSATTCKGSLQASAFCTVVVSFTPTAVGDQVGTLTVTVTNLGVAAVTVALDGSGVAVGGIALNPTRMTFGSVVVNAASTAQTVTLTNSGQAILTGLGVSVTGDFSLTANLCVGTLAAGASCTTGVVFTPTTTGNRTGVLTASSSSAGVVPAVVGLTGNGITAGALEVNPAVASFGAVTVGQSGPAQSVTVTNAGTTTLVGLQFQLAGDYSLPQNNCGAQLAGGGTCSFSVIFSPGVPGTRIGSVTISSTTAGVSPVLVGLEGTGVPAAQLVVTPGQLAFGATVVGLNSAALQLQVRNAGTGGLGGLFFATATPFSVGTGSCGGNLAAGGMCSVPVTFAPTGAGSQSGQLTVSSTSLGVVPIAIPLTGTGLAAASLSLSPSSLDFGGTTLGINSAGQTLVISNAGGVALTGLAIAILGAAAGDFVQGSNGCGTTLAGGASCSIVVSFTPTVVGGRQAFLTVTSSTAGVAGGSVTLTGVGLTPASLSVVPSQLSFGATLLGQVSPAQAVMVRNSGQSGISDLAIVTTAGFAVDAASTTCTATLAGGAGCTVGVVSAPTTVGAQTGLVTVSSALGALAGTVPATATLSGMGALPPGMVTVPASLVQFGTTGIGQAGQPVTVTVSNTGTLSALTGLALAVDETGAANGFGLSNNTCGTAQLPGQLAVGASCTVNVTLVPTRTGQLTGALLMTSGNGANQINLALGGLGFDFQIAVTGSSSATVVRGQTGYYTLAVTPLGGQGGVFSLSCNNLPSNTLCIFNPAVLGPLQATGSVSLGIATGAPTVAAAGRGPGGRIEALVVCGLFGMPLGWWLRRRNCGQGRGKLWPGMMLLVCGLAMLVGGVSGCLSAGGSGGQVHLGGGTPPGSYSVLVNASSGGLTHSVQVTLVVN